MSARASGSVTDESAEHINIKITDYRYVATPQGCCGISIDGADPACCETHVISGPGPAVCDASINGWRS